MANRSQPKNGTRRGPPRPPDLSIAALESAALRYLERYDASAENLRRVLRNRGRRAVARGAEIDEASFHTDVESIIERCLRSGLVDDRRFAESKLRAFRRAGKSTRDIRNRLSIAGVSSETIDELLESEDDPDQIELEAARAYAKRRRFGPFRSKEATPEKLRKELASLARAGFPYEVALRVLESEADDVGVSADALPPGDFGSR